MYYVEIFDIDPVFFVINQKSFWITYAFLEILLVITFFDFKDVWINNSIN